MCFAPVLYKLYNIAGSDATSTAIHWETDLYLLVNPDIQGSPDIKGRVQSDLVVGGNCLPREYPAKSIYCTLFSCCFLLMASPVPFPVLHSVSEDTTIGPYNVPKCGIVMSNNWAIHYDPKVWKDSNISHTHTHTHKKKKKKKNQLIL